MPTAQSYTLSKEERLCSRTLIEKLFDKGGSHSMSAFPLRAVWRKVSCNDGGAPVAILISVPKRCFKRAVKRNRVKRQVREAYRNHKNILATKMKAEGESTLAIAFIWLDNKLHPSMTVEKRVVDLLERINEKL